MSGKLLTITVKLPVREELVQLGMPALVGRVLTQSPTMPAEDAERILFEEKLVNDFKQELKARAVYTLVEVLKYSKPELASQIEPMFDDAVSCEVTWADNLEGNNEENNS